MPVNISSDRVDATNIARISREDANRPSKHIVQTGDIVYSRRGAVTRSALITDDESGMFFGTGCLLVRPVDAINPEFLKCHLSSPRNQEWIIRHAVGATMPNLNTGNSLGCSTVRSITGDPRSNRSWPWIWQLGILSTRVYLFRARDVVFVILNSSNVII